MSKTSITIDFNKFISSISLALDLAEACAFKDKSKNINFNLSLPEFSIYNHNFASHSKKTALIAKFIANKLNYDENQANNLYIASFLHDIGSVEAFSQSHSDSNFMLEHSEFGADIIKKLPVDDEVPQYIRFHHENYDGSGPCGLSGSDIPEVAQIIHVADMFELLYEEGIPYRFQKEKITNWLVAMKGKFFSPTIVDALSEAANAERFWLDIENVNTDPDVMERIHPKIYKPLSLMNIENIAHVFAAIIDKKSAFTHEHSIGLTNYAAKFSKFYGFDPDKTTKMKIAALLHDIGKLSVPNEILDKPGKLTPEEFTIIKSHTYYTKLILNKISGMEEISEWAANHHETLRGTGYPEAYGSDKLGLECRIMSVCDIYQALTESRPYREGMHQGKALGIIDSLVERGDLDRDVVKNLKEII